MPPATSPFNAQERDIDLLLLEEIYCNPKFLSWLADKAGIYDAILFKASHSVYCESGGTDVLVIVDSPDGRAALMIEDKIGAAMQPRQAERYHERGAALCADPTVKSYRTMLIAPESYLQGVVGSEWHATLPFETVARWFEEQGDIRSRWRYDIIIRAVTRQRRTSPGLLLTDSALAKFKSDYQKYASENYKEFIFSHQVGRDREFYFRGASFPKGMRLKHSFTLPSVTLVFDRVWKDKAISVLTEPMPETVWIKHHEGTLDLVTGTEPIDLSESVQNQTDLIDRAMEAARRLIPYASMVQAVDQSNLSSILK